MTILKKKVIKSNFNIRNSIKPVKAVSISASAYIMRRLRMDVQKWDMQFAEPSGAIGRFEVSGEMTTS